MALGVLHRVNWELICMNSCFLLPGTPYCEMVICGKISLSTCRCFYKVMIQPYCHTRGFKLYFSWIFCFIQYTIWVFSQRSTQIGLNTKTGKIGHYHIHLWTFICSFIYFSIFWWKNDHILNMLNYLAVFQWQCKLRLLCFALSDVSDGFWFNFTEARL